MSENEEADSGVIFEDPALISNKGLYESRVFEDERKRSAAKRSADNIASPAHESESSTLLKERERQDDAGERAHQIYKNVWKLQQQYWKFRWWRGLTEAVIGMTIWASLLFLGWRAISAPSGEEGLRTLGLGCQLYAVALGAFTILTLVHAHVSAARLKVPNLPSFLQLYFSMVCVSGYLALCGWALRGDAFLLTWKEPPRLPLRFLSVAGLGVLVWGLRGLLASSANIAQVRASAVLLSGALFALYGPFVERLHRRFLAGLCLAFICLLSGVYAARSTALDYEIIGSAAWRRRFLRAVNCCCSAEPAGAGGGSRTVARAVPLPEVERTVRAKCLLTRGRFTPPLGAWRRKDRHGAERVCHFIRKARIIQLAAFLGFLILAVSVMAFAVHASASRTVQRLEPAAAEPAAAAAAAPGERATRVQRRLHQIEALRRRWKRDFELPRGITPGGGGGPPAGGPGPASGGPGPAGAGPGPSHEAVAVVVAGPAEIAAELPEVAGVAENVGGDAGAGAVDFGGGGDYGAEEMGVAAGGVGGDATGGASASFVEDGAVGSSFFHPFAADAADAAVAAANAAGGRGHGGEGLGDSPRLGPPAAGAPATGAGAAALGAASASGPAALPAGLRLTHSSLLRPASPVAASPLLEPVTPPGEGFGGAAFDAGAGMGGPEAPPPPPPPPAAAAPALASPPSPSPAFPSPPAAALAASFVQLSSVPPTGEPADGAAAAPLAAPPPSSARSSIRGAADESDAAPPPELVRDAEPAVFDLDSVTNRATFAPGGRASAAHWQAALDLMLPAVLFLTPAAVHFFGIRLAALVFAWWDVSNCCERRFLVSALKLPDIDLTGVKFDRDVAVAEW